MEHLPQDVVVDILSRLPVTTLAQSKSVCRAWRRIIQSSELTKKHLSRMSEPDKNDPCIFFQSHWPMQNQYYFVDFAAQTEGPKIAKRISVSTMHANLVASCNGLLCFCNASRIHICNPLTNDSMELPKICREPGEITTLGFGFSPTTKEYKLVEVVYQRKRARAKNSSPSQSQVRVLTIGGSSEWRSLGTAPYKFILQSSQVLVNGRLHWISQLGKNTADNHIISFDVATEQFQEIPKPDGKSLDSTAYELLVLQGSLSIAVSNVRGGIDVWIMKQYNVKESWTREFTVDGCLSRELERMNARRRVPRSYFQAICSFKSGEVLLEHSSKALVLYDPMHETFKDLRFQGAPMWFKMVVHVGSLISI